MDKIYGKREVELSVSIPDWQLSNHVSDGKNGSPEERKYLFAVYKQIVLTETRVTLLTWSHKTLYATISPSGKATIQFLSSTNSPKTYRGSFAEN